VLFISSLVLDGAALVLAVGVLFLVIEVFAALLLPFDENEPDLKKVPRPSAAVLVPAHNESASIVPTLDSIRQQLSGNDRLLVVADNCSDDTAAVVANAGAEVVKRDNLVKIGKGYALESGIKHLCAHPPEIVVIIDADCRLGEGALDRLVRTCATLRRPVQALDLMISPEGSAVNFRVAEFAWRVKNWVRPLGLRALNLPCQLMGTGMAFPWEIMHSAKLGNESVVEDLKLGLELAHVGSAPLFCPSARVISQFPQTAQAASRQRRRWEGGHINMILTVLPHLLSAAASTRNRNLLVLAFDLAVPPLSVLAFLLCVEFAIAAVLTSVGFAPLLLIISSSSLLAFALTIFFCWLRFGRDVLPLRAVVSVPGYVVGKVPMYFRLLSGNIAPQWTRTDRGKANGRGSGAQSD
jgi:cellulose synthase/poly-beta-1,6-N-acetylglucosamine synthase-like glycosyltransferase